MANVKGLVVVESFSVKLTVAVRVPNAVGANWTVKVVLLPAATEVAGWLVTVKSDAFVPVIETVPSVKAAVPLLVMV
jgi:isoprenylcysteine carboxyl methyltransferase (ICMT) family protein YpbQ